MPQQIARCAAVYCVDELVVVDDTPQRKDGTVGAGAAFLARLVQYSETPQYLRKALAPMHPGECCQLVPLTACHGVHLRCGPRELADVGTMWLGCSTSRPLHSITRGTSGAATLVNITEQTPLMLALTPAAPVCLPWSDLRLVGLLPPLDAPHHLRASEWCPYREGVVHQVLGPTQQQQQDAGGGSSSGTAGSVVDIGLDRNCLVPGLALSVGARVTLAVGEAAETRFVPEYGETMILGKVGDQGMDVVSCWDGCAHQAWHSETPKRCLAKGFGRDSWAHLEVAVHIWQYLPYHAAVGAGRSSMR